jgi:hypothetical protein
MDFREFATTEASAALRRARAGSADLCRQQLTTLRAAVEVAAKALASAAEPSPEGERENADLIERLTRAASAAAELAAATVSAEARKAQDSLRTELQAQVDRATAAAASLKDAHNKSEALRKEVQAQADALRKDGQAQADALRSELAGATKRAEATAKELEQVREAAKRLENERRDLARARDTEKLARTSAESDLRKAASLLEKTRAEASALTGALEAAVAERTAAEDAASVAHSQAEAADAKLDAVNDLLKTHAGRVKVLERAQQDHERTIQELKAHKQPPHGADTGRASLSVFEDLVGAFQALAGATTISDVLTTMVEHLATGFTRVALFRVKSNHLQGEHQIGFDLQTDISKVVIPLGMDSLLTRAAGSGNVERLSAQELAEGNRVPFSGTPACALALPVLAGDETLAIVYADDSGAPADTHGSDFAARLRVHFADVMRLHAMSIVTRMTSELKALAELRDYATSLLQEIEAMYVADAGAGKEGHELQERLKLNLDYARSSYANRAALADADAGALLDDAVSAAVGGHADEHYRHDLAVVSGHSSPAQPKRATAS